MLQDYRNYIVNIRNGLIQCGVGVSISPLSTYRELFYEADKLAQILWFYRVMSISGSPLALDDFFIDLNGYYKEKMRQQFYADFQDFYDSYKNISKLAYLAGEGHSDVISEDEDEFDLFGSEVDESTVEEVISGIIFDSELGESVADEPSSKFDGEEVHGTFIDGSDIYSNIDKVLGTGYIPAEISVDLMVQTSYSEVRGVLLDEVSLIELDVAKPEEMHGVYLEDIDSEEYEYSSDVPFNEGSHGDGEVHGTILDDFADTEEFSDFESEDEEVYDDIHYSEEDEEAYDEEVYDDIHYSEDDEDEVYDDINYPDDDEDEVYDDIHYPEEDEEPYDDIHYPEDEDDEGYEEPLEPRIYKPAVKPNTGTTEPPKKKEDEDLSDILQNGVNNLLTKGKRFIINETRKLRDGDQK